MHAQKNVIRLEPDKGDLSRNPVMATFGLFGIAICLFLTGLFQSDLGLKIIFCFSSISLKMLCIMFAYHIRNNRTYEKLYFSDGLLKVDYFNPALGCIEKFELDAYFANARVINDTTQTRYGKKRLILSSRDKALYIGDFLSPDALELTAQEISNAIRDYNRV